MFSGKFCDECGEPGDIGECVYCGMERCPDCDEESRCCFEEDMDEQD